MDVRVELKVCESCGCLWLRAQFQGGIYCWECRHRLRDFPRPETRKRRGRPSRKTQVLRNVWAVAELGGVL